MQFGKLGKCLQAVMHLLAAQIVCINAIFLQLLLIVDRRESGNLGGMFLILLLGPKLLHLLRGLRKRLDYRYEFLRPLIGFFLGLRCWFLCLSGTSISVLRLDAIFVLGFDFDCSAFLFLLNFFIKLLLKLDVVYRLISKVISKCIC